jgi:glucokinase
MVKPQGSPFIAADVGGTHARIGLVSAQLSGVNVLHYERYTCADWPSLTAVLKDFFGKAGVNGPVEHCAVACAGYVLDDAIVNDNLAWPVSISDIRASLSIGQLAVVNDFEAVAYATQFLDLAQTTTVIAASKPSAPGPVLVMGPGTGLGSAVLLPGEPRARVLATEAGQISLAPGTEREIEILRQLSKEYDYVSMERALSGPGLLNLYRVIAGLRGLPVALGEPADVTAAALARSDEAAIEALDTFCALLGSFVGDLAMLYGATGGVFLAGGILPQVRDVLLRSQFEHRFFNKGVMRAFLQKVSVRLMDHGQLGVIGAAGLYLDGNFAQ